MKNFVQFTNTSMLYLYQTSIKSTLFIHSSWFTYFISIIYCREWIMTKNQIKHRSIPPPKPPSIPFPRSTLCPSSQELFLSLKLIIKLPSKKTLTFSYVRPPSQNKKSEIIHLRKSVSKPLPHNLKLVLRVIVPCTLMTKKLFWQEKSFNLAK